MPSFKKRISSWRRFFSPPRFTSAMSAVPFTPLATAAFNEDSRSLRSKRKMAISMLFLAFLIAERSESGPSSGWMINFTSGFPPFATRDPYCYFASKRGIPPLVRDRTGDEYPRESGGKRSQCVQRRNSPLDLFRISVYLVVGVSRG